MLYVFICPDCGRPRIVSAKRSAECAVCKKDMACCEMDYEDWAGLDRKKQEKLIYFIRHTDKEGLLFKRPKPVYNAKECHYYI